jgi:hypothetical protein
MSRTVSFRCSSEWRVEEWTSKTATWPLRPARARWLWKRGTNQCCSGLRVVELLSPIRSLLHLPLRRFKDLVFPASTFNPLETLQRFRPPPIASLNNSSH